MVYLLQTDSLVDEVQTLLDFLADGGWGGKMITEYLKSVFVSDVTGVDYLTIGSLVRILTFLNQRWNVFAIASLQVLYVPGLFSNDVVSGLVAGQ